MSILTSPRPRSRRTRTGPATRLRRARAVAARLRRRFRPVHDRLSDLRHAQPRTGQRDPGLPRADRRPIRRRPAPDHRQARLVGDVGRSRRGARHRAVFSDLRQRARRLHGHDRPEGDQPGDRRALGAGFSGDHDPRHGAGAKAAARPSRHRQPVLRDRRLDGRDAGAAMGRRAIPTASSPRCRSPARRATRRRTSRFTRSAGRRSWPTRIGAAGAI